MEEIVGVMADATGIIPLWRIGIVAGIPMISLAGVSFMVHILDRVHHYNHRRDHIVNSKVWRDTKR